jgi:hypothetical protein
MSKRRIVIAVVSLFVGASAGYCAGGGPPAGAIVYEDGSWETPDGRTGCIAFYPCED